ncbi:assimilatory sulfite reductase (NADPH) hemoprotein subunit [Halofilum ochraceum]|uniref:assimilatory sulfite reductase (NADPH) hemoprotein subunit n=1 Tax=Halofilum ochraceum TaxID=1611323 RepID=UPI0008DB22C7|nr:assimilatory sulfite reductase (NADPH) hemoprotein subunit [Halofilum ochraceum]
MSNDDIDLDALDPTERIKHDSNFLRGTIEQGLADEVTGAIAESDTKLLKFHGSYMQDDRDVRAARQKKKLEPAYSFMIRLRMPAGVCTPQQWLALDDIATRHANGTLRITTRQTFQYHGVIKRDLKTTMRAINDTLLDTIAACGDVNRNVMCSPNPYASEIHSEVFEWSKRISDHLLPRTSAYHEIWLDGDKVAGGEPDFEPIYGPRYLPRKFKIAVAVPPMNDVDIYANCLGFIAITDDKGELAGFNVTVGGGMGMTHGDTATYPRLADVIAFCRPDQSVAVAKQIVALQRDYGDRVNRKHARFKYTVDDHGPEWIRSELEHRLGWSLEDPRDFHFESNADRYGWVDGADGRGHFTLFVENGRIKDEGECRMLTALREIARVHDGEFRMTPNQNVIISKVADQDRPRIEAILRDHGIDPDADRSAVRRSSMACVAFPTCGLAMAESERYLPSLIDRIDAMMAENGLQEDAIIVRMTGCPNGCARPYLGEIGFVGKAPGKYNLYLGAGFQGQRLNKLYRENIGEPEILAELEPMIGRYAKEREDGEPFGDFVIRAGYVHATTAGRNFHHV